MWRWLWEKLRLNLVKNWDVKTPQISQNFVRLFLERPFTFPSVQKTNIIIIITYAFWQGSRYNFYVLNSNHKSIVVIFSKLLKLMLTVKSVDEILWCCNSKEIFLAELLSLGFYIFYFLNIFKKKLDLFGEVFV